MTDSIFATPTPVVGNDFDGQSHAWGMKFTVSADATCVGGRLWIPAAGRPTTCLWQLWRVGDAAKIAESDINGAGHGTPSSGAWYSFNSSLFATPGDVALSSAQVYRVCVAFAGGNGVYTDDGSETFPVGTGVVSATTGSFTNAGGTNVMPGSDYLAWFFADVTVQTGGTDANPTTAAISVTTTVGAPVISTGSTVTPSTGAGTTSIGVPTLSTGATPTPGVVNATTTIPAVSVATGATITPAAVTAAATIGSPTISAGATANPATIAAAAAVGTPAVSTGTTVSPSLLTATVTIPTPAVTTGADLAVSWQVGAPHGRWHLGTPHSRLHVGPPGGT